STARRERRDAYLRQAVDYFARTLELDPENAEAHYNLDLAYRLLGQRDKASEHRAAFEKYKTDDNARDRAILIARNRNPAANHAAEAIVIYDLHRPGAYGMEPEAPPGASEIAGAGG
ncbi:MAG TPA: hypothetical protein VE685_16835, partial [Thermoanaerobaculia bacterium]|nr:hypothetical protein [Thermoanaerobaculia bacterium]